MKTVAIVTDSTAYIPESMLTEYEITMVPLSVIFDNESYLEEKEIQADDFFEKVKKENILPKTSQPSIGSFVETYEALARTHDEIITITLSSGISGTYQSANSAGDMIEGADVYVFDSEISCMMQGFYVLEAARMAQDGFGSKEILSRLQKIKSQGTNAYFLVDDLSHLHRGGRLNAAQLVVGSLLQIKPVLTFEDKQIVPYEKIRTRKKALNKIMTLFDAAAKGGDLINATLIYSTNKEEAENLKAELEEKYTNVNIILSYFGPVIATHLGGGALGLGWYRV
ncbi:DegV family EDD domain-containing protein [Bacillus hwajinpoensis]|uniref:DegV family EDD domain-containing protein n=1 Tax=Guptibacillus hwajinpoensis TaxID=208199 RepID=A0A845ENJ1_9BACL|nr:DegV family protein [Pseudalkalibacillus hwajinpoensis]MYL61961.1 DegV family EDD domain-containing protein [Pseudalkalibacillus hwajinpoensis]